MGLSLEEMGKKIALDTPGFLSFLSGICSGPKLDDTEAYVSMDVDRWWRMMPGEDLELGAKVRQSEPSPVAGNCMFACSSYYCSLRCE